jgi:hypothetical protein
MLPRPRTLLVLLVVLVLPLGVLFFMRAAAPVPMLPTDSTITTLPPTGTDANAPVTVNDGDETLALTSDEQGDDVTLVATGTFGTDGQVQHTIHTDTSGVVRSIEETRTQTAQASDRSPTTMRVTLILTFDGDRVVKSVKKVDGQERPVRPYEIDTARRRAALLFRLRRRAPQTPRN